MTVRTRALHSKHQKQYLFCKIPIPPPIPPPPPIQPLYNSIQTSSVNRDPQDLFFGALLLDMYSVHGVVFTNIRSNFFQRSQNQPSSRRMKLANMSTCTSPGEHKYVVNKKEMWIYNLRCSDPSHKLLHWNWLHIVTCYLQEVQWLQQDLVREGSRINPGILDTFWPRTRYFLPSIANSWSSHDWWPPVLFGRWNHTGDSSPWSNIVFALWPHGSPFEGPGPHGDLIQFLGPHFCSKVPIFYI